MQDFVQNLMDFFFFFYNCKFLVLTRESVDGVSCMHLFIITSGGFRCLACLGVNNNGSFSVAVIGMILSRTGKVVKEDVCADCFQIEGRLIIESIKGLNLR